MSAVLIISIGLIVGMFQNVIKIDKSKIVRKILVFIIVLFLLFIIIVVTSGYALLLNFEEIAYYEDVKMIKETRSFFNSNYIKYYDYMNPFIRSRQERILISYDDTISEDEYGGTTFFNEYGEEVRDFKGTKYIDLAELEKYATLHDGTYQKVIEVLEKIKEKYSNNFYDIRNNENILMIEFSDQKNEVADTIKSERAKNIIDNFILNESYKIDSTYSITVRNGYIHIMNEKYYDYGHWIDQISIFNNQRITEDAKQKLEEFLNLTDLQNREISITYNNDNFMKIDIIKYFPFINSNKELENSNMLGNIGYYECKDSSGSVKTYAYPIWKLQKIVDEEKEQLVFKSEEDTVLVCEYIK